MKTGRRWICGMSDDLVRDVARAIDPMFDHWLKCIEELENDPRPNDPLTRCQMRENIGARDRALAKARAAIACVQQPPTKSEMDLRHDLEQARAEAAQRWRPIETIPRDRPIEAWHKVWKCPVTIVYRSWVDRSAWVEKTLTTEWPLDAFSHWREPAEPPKADSGKLENGHE